MTASRSKRVLLVAATAMLTLAACGADRSDDIADLKARTAALEARMDAAERAAAASETARSDATVAATLSVVQAVGRGQDPTLLPSTDQVAFCRATGWTIRDLAALGQSLRAAVQARDAGIRACRESGIEEPTPEDVAATEQGQAWVQLATAVTRIQRLLEAGQWAEARKAFAPPPATDGG